MRILTSAMCVLPIFVASVSISYAKTATPTGFQSTTALSVPLDRKAYLGVQMSRLERWRQDIADFDDRMETRTTQAGLAAKRELASGLTSLEHASATLGTTSGDDWIAAKATYERAVDALEATWTKVDPRKR